MSNTMPLPPLPRHDKVYSNRWGDGSDATYWYSPETLRARDLEVARVVLEGAAQAAGPEDSYQDRWFAAKEDAVKRIRALEVRHHE